MSNPHPDGALELTDEQRRQAQATLDAVKNGEATHPLDFLDEWHAGPEHRDLHYLGTRYTDATENIPDEVEEWIALDSVRGIGWELYDRFVDSRLKSTLRLLIDGKFQPKYERGKPHYMELDGDLYVQADGTHRTLACKATGVKEIYARVTHVPGIGTTPYRNWMGWRPE